MFFEKRPSSKIGKWWKQEKQGFYLGKKLREKTQGRGRREKGEGRKFMAGSHFVLSAVLGEKNKEEEKQG